MVAAVGWPLALLLSGLAAACGADGDPTPTLPPDNPTPTPTPPPEVSGDDDASNGDQSPPHTLLEADTGFWTLSPTGGPYDALTGTLNVTESLDGSEVYSCNVVYSLTGTLASVSGCPDCEQAYRVLSVLALDSGSPADCYRTDLPADQSYATLGFSAKDGYIYYDYNDTGIWLPWYDAYRDDLNPDRIYFSWSETVGVEISD